LNGNYWGIQNMRERSSAHHILANYGTEDVDVIGNWWGEIVEGDRVAFNLLMTELRKNAPQRNIEWIMNQIDIDQFINYMILQMYVSNTDWPHNNMVMWRPRTTNAKWRFILKDLDFGLGIWDMNRPDHNSMRFATENNNDERKLFNALLTQDSFRKTFYGRYAIYMGDHLHIRSTWGIIDSIQKILEPVMEEHLLRWRSPLNLTDGKYRVVVPNEWWRDLNSWRNEVNKMKAWCNSRNTNVYRHLQEHFRLGTIMTLGYEKPNHPVEVFINDIRMRQTLTASYYQGESVELRYRNSGHTKLVWEISQTIASRTVVETFSDTDISFRVPAGCTTIRIRLVEEKQIPTNSNDIRVAPPTGKIFVSQNQIQIFDLQPPSLISIYDTSGKLIHKTTTTENSTLIPINRKGVFIVHIQSKNETYFTQKIVM